MDCRSTVKRQWIVEHYEVVPVAHIQLLEGQTKHSDAGATIENDYYIFHAKLRKGKSFSVAWVQQGIF